MKDLLKAIAEAISSIFNWKSKKEDNRKYTDKVNQKEKIEDEISKLKNDLNDAVNARNFERANDIMRDIELENKKLHNLSTDESKT